MAYGLSVSNAAGYVQIDQDYSNYAIVSTGTVSLSSIGVINYANYGTPPLVFVKFPSTTQYVGMTQCTNTSTTLGVFNSSTLTGSATVAYMIAVPASAVAPGLSGFGLRVNTASGTAAFDSRIPYPRVSNILVGSGVSSSSSGPWTLGFSPAKSNPWICLSPVWGRCATSRATSTLEAWWTIGVRCPSSGSIEYKMVQYATVPNPFALSLWVTIPTTIVLLENT